MNKKFIFKFFLCCFCFTHILHSTTNNQEIFLQANKFYKEGDFEKAYELYKKIPNPSPKINYNLGNCAYKLNEYGYALLYWKRAEKNWGFFDRNELLDNILLLKKNLSTQETPKNYFSHVKNYIVSLIKFAPLFILQILFLILWFFLFLYIKYLYKQKQKILIILCFILVASLGIVLVIRYNFEYKTLGVVTGKNAILLSGPGKNFQELANLPEASEISIEKSSGQFYKIKFNKMLGWTNKANVGKI